MTAGPERQVTCPHFEPLPGTRRCRDYLSNGGCQREDIFLCTEWLKVNPGHRLPTPETQTTPPAKATSHGDAPEPPTPPPVPRDLFGSPVEPPSPRPKPEAPRGPGSVAPPSPLPPVRASFEVTATTGLLKEVDLVQFRERGLEVCLRSEDLGEVWLVGTYTHQGRTELSIEHALLIAAAASTFPGARIQQIRSAASFSIKSPD